MENIRSISKGSCWGMNGSSSDVRINTGGSLGGVVLGSGNGNIGVIRSHGAVGVGHQLSFTFP